MAAGHTALIVEDEPEMAAEIADLLRSFGHGHVHVETLAEPIDAKIAWLRASGTRWKEICWEVGLARAAAHEHWLYALCVIAWRLNGKERVKHIGRRRLIARVRFGTANGQPV